LAIEIFLSILLVQQKMKSFGASSILIISIILSNLASIAGKCPTQPEQTLLGADGAFTAARVPDDEIMKKVAETQMETLFENRDIVVEALKICSYSTQVVAGLNYRVFVSTDDTSDLYYVVEIHEPLLHTREESRIETITQKRASGKTKDELGCPVQQEELIYPLLDGGRTASKQPDAAVLSLTQEAKMEEKFREKGVEATEFNICSYTTSVGEGINHFIIVVPRDSDMYYEVHIFSPLEHTRNGSQAGRPAISSIVGKKHENGPPVVPTGVLPEHTKNETTSGRATNSSTVGTNENKQPIVPTDALPVSGASASLALSAVGLSFIHPFCS